MTRMPISSGWRFVAHLMKSPTELAAAPIAGAHSTGGGVGLFIFLDAAQLIRQGVGLVLDVLHQVMGAAAGVFQLLLALLD